MKSLFVGACLALASLLPAASLATSESQCTFDQSYQAHQLAKLAARRPGGVIDKNGQSVTWHLRDGSALTVGQGGCMDYGTSVRLTFARGHSPPIAKALSRLVTATARYLSPAYAKDISDVWAHHQFRQSTSGDGSIELDAIRDGKSRAPYPLEIDLTKAYITAGWQEL